MWLDGEFSEVEFNRKLDSPLQFVQFYDQLKQRREAKQEILYKLQQHLQIEQNQDKSIIDSIANVYDKSKSASVQASQIIQLSSKIVSVKYEFKLQRLFSHQRKHMMARLKSEIIELSKKKLDTIENLKQNVEIMSQIEEEIKFTQKSTTTLKHQVNISKKFVKRDWNNQSRIIEHQLVIQKNEEMQVNTQKNFIDKYTTQQINRALENQKLQQDIKDLETKLKNQIELTSFEWEIQLYLIYELFINKKSKEYQIETFEMDNIGQIVLDLNSNNINETLNKAYGSDWILLYAQLQQVLQLLINQLNSQETSIKDLQSQCELQEKHINNLSKEKDIIYQYFMYIQYMNLLQELQIPMEASFVTEIELVELCRSNEIGYEKICVADNIILLFNSFAFNAINKFQINIVQLNRRIQNQDLENLATMAQQSNVNELNKISQNENQVQLMASMLLRNILDYSDALNISQLPTFNRHLQFLFRRPVYQLTNMINVIDLWNENQQKQGDQWREVAIEVNTRFQGETWMLDNVATNYLLINMESVNISAIDLICNKTKSYYKLILNVLQEVKNLKRKMKISYQLFVLKDIDYPERSSEMKYFKTNFNDKNQEQPKVRSNLTKKTVVMIKDLKQETSQQTSLLMEYQYFLQRRNSQLNVSPKLNCEDSDLRNRNMRQNNSNEERNLIIKHQKKFLILKKQYSTSQEKINKLPKVYKKDSIKATQQNFYGKKDDKQVIEYRHSSSKQTLIQNAPSRQEVRSPTYLTQNILQQSFHSKQRDFSPTQPIKVDKKFLPRLERSQSRELSADISKQNN